MQLVSRVKILDMKIETGTFVKAMSYFQDQLDRAKQKEDNEEVVMYYNREIDRLLQRYYYQ